MRKKILVLIGLITLSLISNGCVVVQDEYTSFKNDYISQRMEEDGCKWYSDNDNCDWDKYEKEAQNRYLGIQPQYITILREVSDIYWDEDIGCFNETSGKWFYAFETPNMTNDYFDLWFYPEDIRSYDSYDDLRTWEYDNEPYYYTVLIPDIYFHIDIPNSITSCSIGFQMEIVSHYQWKDQWYNWTETCEIVDHGNLPIDYYAEIEDCLHHGERYYFPRPSENK